MSYTIILFTVIFMSSTEIKLMSEVVDLNHKKTISFEQFEFENSPTGFQEMEKKTNVLKSKLNLPSSDCLFNLNLENQGFIQKTTMPISNLKIDPKKITKDPNQLSVLCREYYAKF